MKILDINGLVSERIKVQPVTNAELDKAQKELERTGNPFGITEKDLTGQIEAFPIGVVVRMMEEQKAQGNESDVKVFQHFKSAETDGFSWNRTDDGDEFWDEIITFCRFSVFFEQYPDYRKYNKPATPNPFHLANADMIDGIKHFPIGVVVRMMEEQKAQGNKPDVKPFQRYRGTQFDYGGFDWRKTAMKEQFWEKVINYEEFGKFYIKYPTYEKYNIY